MESKLDTPISTQNLLQLKSQLQEQFAGLTNKYYQNLETQIDTQAKSLWSQMNIEKRDPEGERQIVDLLIRYERMRIMFDNILDKITQSVAENQNKISEKEHLFLSQLFNFLTFIDQNPSELQSLFSQNGIQISKDDQLLKTIESKINKEIEENDRKEYIDLFHERYKTNTDDDNPEQQVNDNESQWTDNKSEIDPENIIIADEELAQELDRESSEGEKQEENEEKLEEFKEEDESEATFIDGSKFLSGGGDDLAMLWSSKLAQKEESKEVTDNLPIYVFPKHKETVEFVSFNKDEDLIATGCLDGNINVYYMQDKNYALKCKLEGPTEEIRFLEWHKKANVLVAGSGDNSCWMWNVNKGGEVMASFFGHEEKLTCGGFSPDGRVLVTGSEDKSIRVWKPSTGEQVKKISGYGFHEGIVICMDFHQSQSILVSGSDDSTACLVNYETGKKLSIRSKFQIEGGVTKMKILKENNLLIASTNQGRIYMCDYRMPDSLKFKKGGGVCVLDFDVNSQQQVVAGFDDGSIKIFDLKKF